VIKINWLKSLIVAFVLLGLMMFLTSEANAYEVPGDAVIKVFDASGKQIGEMSRAEYKVVKLNTSISPAEVTQTYSYERLRDEAYRKKHNSLVFHLGHGDTGALKQGHDGNNYTVRGKQGPVFGLTYCYTENTWGLCGTGITNETFMFGVKKDF